jgi:hypothetical protein
MALMDVLPRRKEKVAAPPAPPSHTGLLEVGGMSTLAWDTSVPVTVARARAQFEAAISAGYTAQAYKPGILGFGGSRMDGEITREFDPQADVIRMSLPYAGG